MYKKSTSTIVDREPISETRQPIQLAGTPAKVRCGDTVVLADRSMRSHLPKGFRNEGRVVVTILSPDRQDSPDTLCVQAASCPLTVTDIPFDGPVGAIRVGHVDGKWVLSPMSPDASSPTLGITIVGKGDATGLVEGGCHEQEELKRNVELREMFCALPVLMV